MMRIIIDDRNTISLPFILETAVRSGERQNPFFNDIKWNLKLLTDSNDGKCIGYIVVTGNGKCDAIHIFTMS